MIRAVQLLALALCVSQVASVCYLEDSAATCSVCWKTVYGSPDDKVGVTKMSQCADTVTALYDTPPPLEMYEGSEYPVTFSLTVDKSVHTVVPGSTKDDGPKEIPHANIHSCISSRGACTPFVANTPGLSTHTPASVGDFDGNKATFEGTVDLPVDTYTIIAHVRYYEPNADDAANPPTKIDVAVGLQRDVLPAVNEISAEAYIMAGVVGAILLLCGAMIYYAVRTGKVDLDYIMELMFSDYVTLPSDIICGLADAVAFTISIVQSVHGNNDLMHIVPICWMFAALSYMTSLYCAYYDYYQIWDLYQSYYNQAAYDSRMLKSLANDWTRRHGKDAPTKIGNKDRKAAAKRVSQDWDMKRMSSVHGVHHQTMVDYDMAAQDFSRRRRTIMSIIMESIPITAIQAYVLIEGGSSMISVLALLLAALLLGSKMQGLGDYGNAKKRRQETMQAFDARFGGVDRLASAIGKVNGTAMRRVSSVALPAALNANNSDRDTDASSDAAQPVQLSQPAQAQAEMFVAVASSGGGIQATPRQQPLPYAMTAQNLPYQPASSVQNGLPAPAFTPRVPGMYSSMQYYQ